MKKNNPLQDVTHMTKDDWETQKIGTIEDYNRFPSGDLLADIISSIADPNLGNGRPACLRLKSNGVVVTLLITVVEAKVVSPGEGEVLH